MLCDVFLCEMTCWNISNKRWFSSDLPWCCSSFSHEKNESHNKSKSESMSVNSCSPSFTHHGPTDVKICLFTSFKTFFCLCVFGCAERKVSEQAAWARLQRESQVNIEEKKKHKSQLTLSQRLIPGWYFVLWHRQHPNTLSPISHRYVITCAILFIINTAGRVAAIKHYEYINNQKTISSVASTPCCATIIQHCSYLTYLMTLIVISALYGLVSFPCLVS